MSKIQVNVHHSFFMTFPDLTYMYVCMYIYVTVVVLSQCLQLTMRPGYLATGISLWLNG